MTDESSNDKPRRFPPNPPPPPPEIRATWRVDQPDDAFRASYPSQKRQCTAASKQNGRRCMRIPRAGKNVCVMHGADGGKASAAGRYSVVAGKLGRVYEQSLVDRSLTDLKEPLAMLDALTQRAMERASEREVPELRARSLGMLRAARRLGESGESEQMFATLDELDELLEHGVGEDKALAAAIDAFERFAQRLEAYWKIQLDRKQAINATELVAVMARIVQIIQENAAPDVARTIASRIDHYLASGALHQSPSPN